MVISFHHVIIAGHAEKWNREDKIPRNGSGIYSLPPGLPSNGDVSNATDDLLTPLGDLETDMNTVRPVVAGGTGASSASAARTALGLAIGTDVQAYDADLASWAGVTRASGFDTFAATPSSANLRALLTDETGTGAALFSGGDLGTPSAAVLTNATGLPFTGLAAAAVTTSSEAVFSNDSDTQVPTSAAVIDAIGAHLIVADEKTSGTDGGGFTSGAWRTRTLNTTRVNAITGASLSSNQVTLPAGTYLVDISAPALRVNSHQARLQNITAGTTLLWGSSEITEQSGAIVQSRSFIRGTITLAGSTVIEVQHAALTTFGTSGFGQAMGNAGAQEVYTIAAFQRIG